MTFIVDEWVGPGRWGAGQVNKGRSFKIGRIGGLTAAMQRDPGLQYT